MNNTLIFEYSAWFILLCIVLAFGYAFLLYFRDKKFNELSKLKINLLASLRFFSSLIISLLLLSPLLKSVQTSIEKPIIIFAIDNTQSLEVSCEHLSDNFSFMQQEILNSIDDVTNDFKVHSFSFGSKLSDTLFFDFTKDQTDISNVFEQINNKFYNKNIGAVVLVSDGIYNKGANPIYNLKNVIYPVYTVGVGDTTVYKDILIEKVEYNEIAFLNNRFPLVVTVNSKKLNGQNAVCNVYQNGLLLSSQSFKIGSDNYIEKLTFNIETKKSGVQQYLVTVTKFVDERNTTNNTKNFAVNVIENRQKILILSNSPHPDVAAIANSLRTNQNFEVNVATINNFSENISDYSLVIFHHLPSTTNSIKNIISEISLSKIPTFFVLGTQVNYNELNSLNLGLTVSQLNAAYDDANAYFNQNFSEFEISEEFVALLKSSPPFIVPFGNFQVSTKMKTLLYQKVKTVNTTKPLLVFSNNELSTGSSVGFLVGENIWRLRMNCFINYGDFDVFDEFVNQITQALVLKVDKNRFRVNVDKIISENQEVVFKAELYDKIYQLTNTPDVKLTVTDSIGNSFDYDFRRTQKAYNLNIGSLAKGEYSYIASTELSGESFTTSGSFVVVDANIEAIDLVANHNLLFKIAENTGGEFLYPSQLDSLNIKLNDNPNIVSIAYDKQELNEFIKFKWIFYLILSLLSLEWFLRKFFGSY